MRCALYRRRRGQALTEFALILPLLALLLVGLIEFGFLLYAHIQVSSAAREGARAASLYRSTRYSALPDSELGSSNPRSCATGVAGWSLQQVIEQAIVRYPLTTGNNAAGCPTTSGTIIYSALGRLDSARSTATPPTPFTACPSGNANGWSAGVSPALTYVSGDPISWPGPTPRPSNFTLPGYQATVTLCYPYRLILLSDLLPFIGEPVWINKSVNFQFQP